MNKRLFRLILLLPIIVISAQNSFVHSSRIRGLNCSLTKNHLISRLIEQNVELLDAPKKSKKCGIEWGKFGTCCEYKSLMSYQKTEHQRFINSTNNFLENLRILVNSSNKNSEKIIAKIHDWKMQYAARHNAKTKPPSGINQIYIRFQNGGSRRLQINKVAGNENIRSQPYLNAQSNYESKKISPESFLVVNMGKKALIKTSVNLTDEELADHRTEKALEELEEDFIGLIDLSKMMEGSLTQLETSQHRCSAKLSAYKTAALCSTCSVIKECHDYWLKLVRYVDEIAQIEETLDIVRSMSPMNGELFQGDKHDDLLTIIENSYLRNALKNSMSISNYSIPIARNLCTALVSIYRGDRLEKTAENLVRKQSSELTKTMTNFNPSSINPSKKKTKMKKSNKDKKNHTEHHKRNNKNLEEHHEEDGNEKNSCLQKTDMKNKELKTMKGKINKDNPEIGMRRVLSQAEFSDIEDFSHQQTDINTTQDTQTSSSNISLENDGQTGSLAIQSTTVYGGVFVVSHRSTDYATLIPGMTVMNLELDIM